MILHENVTLLISGTEVRTRAEVIPLRTDERKELDRTPSSVNYRVVLPALDPADEPRGSDQIYWRGTTYDLIGPAMKYTMNGKLHHLEVFITRSTG